MLRCRSSAPFGWPVVPRGVEDHRGVVLVGADRLERRRLIRAIPCPSVSVPSIGEAAAGSTVIIQKCSQPSACSNPACPSLPIGSSVGALEAEVGLRVGVAQVVGDLAALEQHVQRHHGGAGLEDAEVDDREVRQVRAAERDLVAAADAAGGQQVGHLVGRAVDLGVGEPGVAEDDRLAVGVLLRSCPRAGSRGCTSCLTPGPPSRRGRGANLLRTSTVRQPSGRGPGRRPLGHRRGDEREQPVLQPRPRVRPGPA